MKDTRFTATMQFIDLAVAEEYKNPLLSWVKFVFTDDQPNANKQGIKQSEFDNLIKSMKYMPIKANYEAESGLLGHSDAKQIGIITAGQQEANKVVAVGALYNDEFPEIISFFKKETSEGRSVDFSWEIRYKESEIVDDCEWLKDTVTKAITAVKAPAYQGRTPLVSVSSFDWMKVIEEELKSRGVEV
jgi:hypothetical protein